MDSFFKMMDKDTYHQIIGDDFDSFKKQYQQGDSNIADNIEEIKTDMDLVLEGVPAQENNHYLQMGLIILEFCAKNFKYSQEKLTYNDKINELKQYYYSNGYNNTQILDLIGNFKKRMSK